MFKIIVTILVFLSLAGIFLKIRNLSSPNWFNFLLYLPLGLISLFPMTVRWDRFDALVNRRVDIPVMKSLLVSGLFLYAMVGIIYTMQRPVKRKWPLDHHEIFHLMF